MGGKEGFVLVYISSGGGAGKGGLLLSALPFAIALCLLHRGGGVDLCNLALLLAAAVGLAHVAAQLCRGDVDAGLVGCALVGLARERLEVVAVGGVAELLDVGVVDLQAELLELDLDAAEDLALWLEG